MQRSASLITVLPVTAFLLLSACSVDSAQSSALTGQPGDEPALEGGSGPSGGGGNLSEPNGTDPGACAEVTATAENVAQPSDIIIAIDQSGSMDDETNWVKNQLSGFAAQITQSGIDVRVVVIAGKPGSENGFCVPAPLGSGSCPNDDTAQLRHVDQHVDSNDALAQILLRYDSYSDVLRPDASKHVVVISDDDAKYVKALTFDQQIRAMDPSFENYRFHSIVASDDNCDYAADEGEEYMLLTSWTGGVFGDLCLQNFQPVWDAVSTQVVSEASIGCAWGIPAPPDGQLMDPGAVNVNLAVDGGAPQPLGFVANPADCALVSGGWTYDDPQHPTKVVACPATCDLVQSADAAQVDIAFGCKTALAVPK